MSHSVDDMLFAEDDDSYGSSSNNGEGEESDESEYTESTSAISSPLFPSPAASIDDVDPLSTAAASIDDVDRLSTAAASTLTPATFQAISIAEDEDDDDVQILTAAEAAMELAAAARRAVKARDCPRKRKRSHVEEKAEPTECTICCDACTLVGRHRLVALKCGHLFGKKCIERWISERRTCPNCSAVIKRTDIYPLFSDHVAVVDNSGLEAMTKKYEQEKSKCEALEKEMKELGMKMVKFKKKLAEATRAKTSTGTCLPAIASHATECHVPVVSTAQPSPSDDTLHAAVQKYKPLFNMPLTSARVFSIAPSCSSMCVGEKFGQNSHGILMVVVQDSRRKFQIPVHTSAVRDMCIQPMTDNVVTVSFDGKLAVTSLRHQKVMLKVALPTNRRQGWSCSYSAMDPHAIYCGFRDGRVAQYDIRKPAEGDPGIVKMFALPERQPVHSIQPFKCTEEGQRVEGLAAATFGGLSVWRNVTNLSSVVDRPVDDRFIEVTPFAHVKSDETCFSLASNQLSSEVVVSSRSSPIKHSVFDLRTIAQRQLAPKIKLTGHKAASVLTRSAMWSERNGLPVVASWSHDLERVTLWNVATHRELCEPLPTSLSAASAAVPVVDIHHVVANKDWNAGVALFGTMTSSHLYMYCSKGCKGSGRFTFYQKK